MSTVERYPLAWPTGWTRTPAGKRQRADFWKSVEAGRKSRPDGSVEILKRKANLNAADASERLQRELDRLGARDAILSTNLQLRIDGVPRSNQADPWDTGAAVYFTLKNKPLCLACDKWNRVADNIAALAQHIDALRRIDRYGVGSIEQAFAGYTALPEKTGGKDWRSEMGFESIDRPSWEDVETRYRQLARERHPDGGGSHEAMARLNVARAAAHAELKAPELAGAR